MMNGIWYLQLIYTGEGSKHTYIRKTLDKAGAAGYNGGNGR